METLEIGKRIKAARQFRKMTQAELSEDIVTRNMLSAIENSKALPSLGVLYSISEKLNIPIDYFFSDKAHSDVLPFVLNSDIPHLRKLSKNEKYEELIELGEKYLSAGNYELDIMLANAYCKMSVNYLYSGDLHLAREYIEKSDSIFVSHNLGFMKMYTNFISYSAGKLLESIIPPPFDGFGDEKFLPETVAYLYIINLIDKGMSDKAATIYDTMKFSFAPMSIHINSRLAASKFNYSRAKELLEEIISEYETELPLPLVKILYGELEGYCTKVGDYKSAYEYSNKRSGIEIS